MPPLAVIFDHDGTLVDSLAVVVAATNDVLRAHGVAELPPRTIIAGMVMPTAERMGLHAGVGAAAEQRVLACEYYLSAHRIGPGLARAYAGIPEAVGALRSHGLLQAVVSNNEGRFVRTVLTALDLSEHFACMYGEEDIPALKPDPSGPLAAARVMGVDPRRCVYVGDSGGDALAGRAAGMRTIGVTWGILARAEMEGLGFDALVDRPQDLIAAIMEGDRDGAPSSVLRPRSP
ncbi:MAG: HAD family hydrolase [Planctomycetes bacterium]|nr:HAD family hydrolase [Planctomycetota bacterium]